MTLDELLDILRQRNIALSTDGIGGLRVLVTDHAFDPALRNALRENKKALLELIESGAYASGGSCLVEAPPNGIPGGCETITPEMLPLVNLSAAEIEQIVAMVPGGAANTADIYPLAPLQEGMLFHYLLRGEGDPYVLRTLLRVDRRDRIDALTKALQAVIDRHDILRTSVVWEGLSEPVQVVWRHAPLLVEEVKLDRADGAIAEQLASRYDRRRYRMDLHQSPLIRIAIARDADEWVMILLMHHLIADHTTMKVIFGEVDAYLRGEATTLPAPLPFRNFVAQARLGVSRAEHEAFFSSLLGDIDEPTLPLGLSQVRGDGSEIAEARERLDDALAQRLRAQARALGVSTASICHLAWARVLGALCGRDDVVFGTVLLGRMQGGAGADRVPGLFINTLPVRIGVGETGVRESVQKTHALLAQLLRHEHAPLALVQRCSGVAARTPLFSALLNYRHSAQPSTGDRQPDLAGIELLKSEERTNYPVALSVDDLGVGFALTAQVDASVDALRICSFMRTALEGLVTALESRPHLPAGRIEVLSETERRQVLVEWNATEAAYPAHLCIHELFEAQVLRDPDVVAVVYDEAQLTYGELNSQANRLARHLRKLGVGPDKLVGLCVERGLEMVVGILAVLKAGGAYVPLDPGYPIERLAYMVKDSAPVTVLTDAAVGRPVREMLETSGAAFLELEGDAHLWADASPENLEREGLAPSHLAYVIYTSGSTGEPKGVMVEHRGVCNIAKVQAENFSLTPESRVLQFVSFGFDISVWDIVMALCNGSALCLAHPNLALATQLLAPTVERYGITHAALPPAVLNCMAASPQWRAVRSLVVGGEAPTQALTKRWAEDRDVVNGYGPTEATVCATLHKCDPALNGAPPIGRPIANTRIYILDAHQQPVPVGVVGELYIGGVGVARGYLNRPELTAERFIVSPFVEGDRLYKTGDLGRYRADGSIEFIGRNDDQVKVRGFRIELGEIEARLRDCAGVAEAVVVTREERGEKQLVAYYLPAAAGAEVSLEDLRGHLTSVLPEYMVPSAYVRLDAFPLTPNGKLDRSALPAPDGSAYAVQAYEAPVGEIEELLASVWSELLGVAVVGREDNFFTSGGHSLLAVRLLTRLRQALQVEVSLTELFAHPVLRDFATTIAMARRSCLPPMTPVSRELPLPVSFAQQRLWILSQFDGVSAAYHIPVGLRIRGELDRAALKWALDGIVARHEPLRTTFAVTEGEVVQQIGDPACGCALTTDDLRTYLDADGEITRLTTSEATAPFDLTEGPLIRGRLIQVTDTEHVLVLTLHHIVADGWSTSILLDELGRLYRAYDNGEGKPLAPLAIQYADYALWQRAQLGGAVLQEQAAYWERTLADAPALLELPTDRARPARPDHVAELVGIELDAKLTAGLKALSRRHGTTLYMTLLAAWSGLLSRLSGQDEVVVGSPTANRGYSEIESLIGFFVNTLALRVDISGNPTVGELLARVRHGVLGAQEHQDIPFEQVVELLNPPRSLSHTPVFQVMFAWQNMEAGTLSLPGLELEPLAVPYRMAKFDLTLGLREVDDRIVGGLEYATALFDAATVKRYAGYLQRMLAAMVADDAQRVNHIALLSDGECRQVLVEWNATEGPYPADRCVHELFEKQVVRDPDAVAVVFEDEQLSYGEVNARANRLAHYLREIGVGPDMRVGLCVERSLEMVVGILAVLKAGGAYVPLDPSYPNERLAYMVEDSAPLVLLTHSAVAQSVRAMLSSSGRALVELDGDARSWADASTENLERCGLTPSHLAYVIYTSGSTGQPKGVMIEHGGVCNLAVAQAAAFGIDPDSRVLQSVSVAFDVSISDVVTSWGAGATLYLYSNNLLMTAQDLAQAAVYRRITHAAIPVSILEVIPDEVSLPSVHTLVVGGEASTSKFAKRWAYGRRLFNAYGPTESTVCATLHKCDPAFDGAPPIGRPIANTRIYILDMYQQPVPVGVVGELYIGGVGVARGYLNRPELTAERFVPSPFVEGDRLYKTGDLGRYLPDGKIEFVGRNDFQVKVRGFRIELGEIEARLRDCAGVAEALVVAREERGEKQLVAYYTPAVAGAELGVDDLRGHLMSVLPGYMVPSAYVRLDTFPLTPNGKLDRGALPAPDGSAYTVQTYEAPVGETELLLVGIWSDLLGIEHIGRRDNFFDLGGHSFLAVMLLSRLQQQNVAGASITEVFNNPTIQALAAFLDQAKPVSAVVNVRPTGNAAPLFLVHEITGTDAYFPSLTAHIDDGIPVYGLVGPSIHETQYETMEELAERLVHAIIATEPEGPYRIGGFSFGGVLAYEVAAQLMKQQRAVTFVGLLDSYHPATFSGAEPDDIESAIEDLLPSRADLASFTKAEARRILLRQAAYARACKDYAPPSISAPVYLFKAMETSPEMRVPADGLLGWSASMPRDQIALRHVPGSHLTMMDTHVADLGRAISLELEHSNSREMIGRSLACDR